MTPARQTIVAAALVVAAALAASALLWPRDLLAPLPIELGDYFSAAELTRWDDFRGTQRLLWLAAALAWLAAAIAVILRAPLAGATREGLAAAATGALAALGAFLIALPFAWIATARAQREGLVTQSQTAWLLDSLLSAAITAAIAACLMGALWQLLRRAPRFWWAGAAMVIVTGAAMLSLLAPLLIEPLFANFRAPGDTALERDARLLAARAGIEPGKLQVVDASKRTGGVNAYVSGWGPTERIVFYDTLLTRFSRAEARGVLAHEIAHARHNDIPRGLLWLALFALPSAFAVSLVVRPGTRGELSSRVLPRAAVALLVVGAFGSVASSPLSRQVEARADATALQLTGDPVAARALTVQLARQNLADPDPPTIYHRLFGSHPTIEQRLGSIERYARQSKRRGR